MIAPRLLFAAVLAALVLFEIQGCRRSAKVEMPADSAAAEFLEAYLDAHNKKDLEAEKALVDWDDITERSREHCLREMVGYDVQTNVASAKIQDIPGLNPRFAATYNIPPEKFLVVVYADSRGDITVKYPIGRKDGRYYFALFGLTSEAMQRNSKRLPVSDRK